MKIFNDNLMDSLVTIQEDIWHKERRRDCLEEAQIGPTTEDINLYDAQCDDAYERYTDRHLNSGAYCDA